MLVENEIEAARRMMEEVNKSPCRASSDVANQFPLAVIEVPLPSYHSQGKTDMRVSSRLKGGTTYAGPCRLYPRRWKHIAKFYIVELSVLNYYQAASLTAHPHYSMLRSEFPDYYKALLHHQETNPSSKIVYIKFTENFHDDFLLVINDVSKFPSVNQIIKPINDLAILTELLSKGSFDENCDCENPSIVF